jgi:hypothetical protein
MTREAGVTPRRWAGESLARTGDVFATLHLGLTSGVGWGEAAEGADFCSSCQHAARRDF